MTTKRYWTCYWREKYWLNNKPGVALGRAGGSFTKRGVSEGDVLYVVSQTAGQLLLGARMTVKDITTREEAVRRAKTDALYEAPEWAFGRKGIGTPLRLHRRLAPEIAEQLCFISDKSGGRKGLLFVNDNDLDRQTTRIVRELTTESASLLDEIIDMTDKRPTPGVPVTITDQQLRKNRRTSVRG